MNLKSGFIPRWKMTLGEGELDLPQALFDSGHFSTLPTDLCIQICTFLSGPDIIALRKVSISGSKYISGVVSETLADLQVYGECHVTARNMDARFGTDVHRQHRLFAQLSDDHNESP